MVGQRGVRVSTVMSELGGEKIDIIEWSENPEVFVSDSLSPAKTEKVVIDNETKGALVEVLNDQQSLAIGKGGQNVRLAAKLTGFRIDIKSIMKEGASEDSETVEETEVTDQIDEITNNEAVNEEVSTEETTNVV